MHDTETADLKASISTEEKSITAALRAVACFHSDTSKLLVDCDKFIGRGRKSVFGNYATKDLSYNVKANFWMPEGMFRYYEAGPSLVDGVCVTFFNPAGLVDPKLETSPVFKAARIQYRSPQSPTIPRGNYEVLKDLCDGWDIWSLFFKHAKQQAFGQVMEFNNVANGSIEWARLVAVPLLCISRIDDALDLARKIGSTVD